MIPKSQNISRFLNQHAGKVLISGVLAVIAYNWRLWQRDRAEAFDKRTQQSPVPTLSRTPKVSVLVAAWNESQHIEQHINSFLNLAYPQKELILCAGGKDDTLETARCYASDNVIVLEQIDGEGKQRALARCMERAGGEIIYLTDADCLYSDDALLRIVAPLIKGITQATTGGVRPLDEQYQSILPWYLWASDATANARSAALSRGLQGRNAAITRNAIEQSGGMGFDAPTGTDYHLALRLRTAGFSIHTVPDSIVATEYPDTLDMYRRKQARWLRNLLIYGTVNHEHQDVIVTARTVMTGLVMLLTPAVAMLLQRNLFIPWGLLFTHAVCSKYRYVFFTSLLAQRSVPWSLFVSIPPLTYIDFAIWASPILDILHSRRRRHW